MKKFFCILLASMLTFSLVACGNNESAKTLTVSESSEKTNEPFTISTEPIVDISVSSVSVKESVPEEPEEVEEIPEDILDGIKSGKAYVAYGKDGPVINRYYGDTPMGGTAVYDKNTSRDVSVKYDKPCNITLVTSTGENLISRGSIKLSKVKFAYIRITNKMGRILAVSNPIYFKEEK